MKRAISLIIPVILFITGCSTQQQATPAGRSGMDKLQFRGSMIDDRPSGLVINPTEGNEAVVVINSRDGYGMVLPYYSEWDFTLNSIYSVWATHETLNCSVEIIENDGLSDDEFIKNLDQNFINNRRRYGILNTEILIYRDIRVLKTEVDPRMIRPEIPGASILRQYNYYSMKTQGDRRFKIHFSYISVDGECRYDEKDLLDHLVNGLIFNPVNDER